MSSARLCISKYWSTSWAIIMYYKHQTFQSGINNIEQRFILHTSKKKVPTHMRSHNFKSGYCMVAYRPLWDFLIYIDTSVSSTVHNCPRLTRCNYNTVRKVVNYKDHARGVYRVCQSFFLNFGCPCDQDHP